MVIGYVITDTRKDAGGFWVLFPRLVTSIQRRYFRRAGRSGWDYWSARSELEYRRAGGVES